MLVTVALIAFCLITCDAMRYDEIRWHAWVNSKTGRDSQEIDDHGSSQEHTDNALLRQQLR
jgi:hypothetical protein